MRHVTAIRKIIDDGDVQEAHSALENLLSLGPNNIEALKLKARLYASEGRFKEEAQVWDKVLTVDREDVDGINFLFKQQTEDREHFYFTDNLPGGGRRYLAYPKILILTSIFGLIGCVMFLSISKLGDQYPVLNQPEILFSAFGICVLAPWFAIIYAFIKAIKSVCLTPKGITIATRFKTKEFKWTDLKSVDLIFKSDPDEPNIKLRLHPKNEEEPVIFLDLSDHSSAIRAKSHFIRELGQFFPGFNHLAFEKASQIERKAVHY